MGEARRRAEAQMDAPNGTPPPTQDPLAIATEVYLLDALLMHGQAVANQFAFRGKPVLAQQLMQLLTPLAGFRAHVDGETRGGIVLAGPGALPPGHVAG